MRCKACNMILNDYELSRKEKETEEFLDLCDAQRGIHFAEVFPEMKDIFNE